MKTSLQSNRPIIILCCFIAFVFLLGCMCSGGTPPLEPTPTASVAIPSFPWPPPRPSTVVSLTLGSLGKSAGAGLTLGDVDTKIGEVLALGGYSEKSYYSVPNGFAVVTRLEQINSDGYPDYSNRWISELASVSIKDFSLNKYLEALFSVPKGRYRIFVFIVTSDLVVQSGTPVSQSEAEAWVVEGANKLPGEIKSAPYSKEHTCIVYVYEFIQSGVGGQASQNTPSNITGKEHLERAGLWELLEK